jgi:hemerythrin
MAIFQWNQTLSVGNQKIDQQHQQLFEALAKLQDAMKAGKGKEEVMSTLRFLSNYVDKHFADEEELMKKHNYPDFENHKKIHENFKAKVKEYINKYNASGADLSTIVTVQQEVGDWLIKHIGYEDKKYAPYIK